MVIDGPLGLGRALGAVEETDDYGHMDLATLGDDQLEWMGRG